MITNLFNTVKKYIEQWFSTTDHDFKKDPPVLFEFKNERYSIDFIVYLLAWNLFKGWNCDYKMNSQDKDIVFAGTKEGIISNTNRNKVLEKLESFFIRDQKPGGEPTTESLAMALDKAIILYMKIINNADKNKIENLQKQLDFVLSTSDKLYHDIVQGNKKIIQFSHIKDYML